MSEILSLQRPDLYIPTRRGLYGLLLGDGEAEAHPIGLWNIKLWTLLPGARGSLSAIGSADDGLYAVGRDNQPVRVEGFGPRSVTALATPQSGGPLYAGCDPASLHRADAPTGQWEELVGLRGPWLEGGQEALPPRVSCLLALDGGLLVGVHGAGVLRSADSGRSFEPLGDGLPPTVRCLEMHASQPERLLVGTEQGLYRSEKAGYGWSKLPVDDVRHAVTALWIDPDEPERLLVGAARHASLAKPALPEGADSRIYQSQDGGNSFRELNAQSLPLLRGSITCFLRHPADKQRIFASVSSGELLLSEDAGASWTMIVSTLPGAYGVVTGPGSW